MNFDAFDTICNIKIIGVGGAGNNAVNCMFEENIIGCEFYALNTDAQILGCSKVEIINFICDVVNEIDNLKNERMYFLKKYLTIPDSGNASLNIINSILHN